MSKKNCNFAHFLCAKAKQETMSKPINILQTIARYRALGIEEQIDYKRRSLDSLVASSVALSMDDENENYLIGPYEVVR